MTGFSVADLDAMLKAASGANAPNVAYGAQSCFGVLRRTPVRDGETLKVIDSSVTVLVRDGALVDVDNDTDITVDGEAFQVRDPGYRDADGTRRLTLVEV